MAPHGAGLANIVVSALHTPVLEIGSIACPPCFLRLALKVGGTLVAREVWLRVHLLTISTTIRTRSVVAAPAQSKKMAKLAAPFVNADDRGLEAEDLAAHVIPPSTTSTRLESTGNQTTHKTDTVVDLADRTIFFFALHHCARNPSTLGPKKLHHVYARHTGGEWDLACIETWLEPDPDEVVTLAR